MDCAALCPPSSEGQGSALDQLDGPAGVEVDVDGMLIVSDSGNHRVVRWDVGAIEGVVVAGGQGAGSDANQLNSPAGVYVDSASRIFVADQGNHRVVRWDPIATEGVVVAVSYDIGTSLLGCGMLLRS